MTLLKSGFTGGTILDEFTLSVSEMITNVHSVLHTQSSVTYVSETLKYMQVFCTLLANAEKIIYMENPGEPVYNREIMI